VTARGGRVLIVEDDDVTRDLLSRRLQQDGCSVAAAASGREALDLIESQLFSLLLLDIEMPGMSGLEVLTVLRRRYSPTELPIIVVVPGPQNEHVVEALSLGANDYVTAPIDLRVARARIQTQLSRLQAEADLRESEERYALAARGSNDGLWDWDLRTNLISLSSRWKSTVGCDDQCGNESPEVWLGRVHPDDVERLSADIAAHVEGRTSHLENQHRILHADGSYRWVLSRGVAVRDAAGNAYRMAGSQTDITEGKVSDPLTGLPNRALFMDRLRRSLERTRRHHDYVFAVLFLDLDRFKLVNDTHGHRFGDQLLIAIGQRIANCLRATDTVARLGSDPTLARLGGDEFTILLEDIRHAGDAVGVAECIQEALRSPFHLDGHETFTSVSIGIATSVTAYSQPDDLLRDADTAMYRAKALGKARCEIFDARMRNEAVERLTLETDLRRALERGEFQVYYQPIVALRSGALVGFEALVRWLHPHRGLVLPCEFIPAAEETGAILPIGAWVLAQSCRQMQAWPEPDGLAVSVNLSGRQFAQRDLVEQVTRALESTGLPGSRLKLEITESTIVQNLEAAGRVLQRLKGLGVQVAIDDFGTGFSSLSYLDRLPIDAVKIDRSFVRSITADRSAIVRATIALAHNLNLHVVAEGIDTEEQAVQLSGFGCEYGQGYLYGAPMPATDAETLMTVARSRGRSIQAAMPVPVGRS
jgi:diguanylate cyclase (GGDEF)-like protein/PAS domain S-box-containing protein